MTRREIHPQGRLRRGTALSIDLALHALVAAAVGTIVFLMSTGTYGETPNVAEAVAVLAAMAGWIIFSFVHRTVLQSRSHATFGKWLMGLCVIRPEDGTWPSFCYLVKSWFVSLGDFVCSGNATDGEDGLPAVVRRADMAP